MATSVHQDAAVVTPTDEQPQSSSRRPIILIILALVLLVGGYFGYQRYQFGQAHEDTDDAQVEGDVYPVIPRVGGPVLDVKIDDNQVVKKGDVVVTIDPADYQQRVNAAEAALAAAQANVVAARTSIGTAQANVKAAQATIGVSSANRARLQKDLKRSTFLRKEDIIPQSDYDAVQANLQATTAQRATAEQQVAVARQQVAAAEQQVAVAQAVVKQRQADLDNAKLQLSYTTITAPANGVVSRKNVQPGQVVAPGQQLFGLVASDRTWVVANFKETQLENMKVGQKVNIEVDAYPNEEFEGHVESLSAATGARFALLPPDNSTGNFVKVTQRVPVKIALDKVDPEHPLRAGMSVTATVAVK
ncbi:MULTISPECIES: HlyD family secretion protein [Hymenobacter]|uniref:HlyD family secretion protein n=2 Tax=Hymenobacter TaxID=89966 RepID=A0ABS6WZF1_9BACT|nr:MULTISPECIES: HlyD family secretion protein [Hymenobacter]MBO3271138.1 HlyD family secretion protein [Hymenobacter defluvii]MBW3128888.1 HlyD family secretion protein [Hymenobacter profundi]QNE41485.1 HlyD family secretion protein [Hymenobacter sp. NBH84]